MCTLRKGNSYIDAHEYTPEAKHEDWAYLGSGIVVRTDAGALVRFADPLAPGLLWRDSGADDGKPMRHRQTVTSMVQFMQSKSP